VRQPERKSRIDCLTGSASSKQSGVERSELATGFCGNKMKMARLLRCRQEMPLECSTDYGLVDLCGRVADDVLIAFVVIAVVQLVPA